MEFERLITPDLDLTVLPPFPSLFVRCEVTFLLGLLSVEEFAVACGLKKKFRIVGLAVEVKWLPGDNKVSLVEQLDNSLLSS